MKKESFERDFYRRPQILVPNQETFLAGAGVQVIGIYANPSGELKAPVINEPGPEYK